VKSQRRANLLLRAAVLIVMALAIGAPTPGHISGCSSSTGGVEPETFCVNFQTRVCERDRVAGRIDDAMAAECRNGIGGMCSGFNFPAGCSVSASTAEACYGALVDPPRIGTVATIGNPMLGECTNLCGGAGGGVDPEGI
jgi:hypothetical protein